jgi:ABC-2 type transport system permease protein
MNAVAFRLFALVRCELWQRIRFRRRLGMVAGGAALLGLLGTGFIALFTPVLGIRIQPGVTAPDGAALFMIVGAIGLVIVLIRVLGYFMHALFDERLDRSILFWQSLPVSDTERVAAKTATGLFAIPLVNWAYTMMIAAILLFFLSLSTSLMGHDFWGSFWQPVPLLSVIVFFGVFFPVFMLWLFPVLGWLLFCSAWSSPRRRRASWSLAIGVPLVLGILEPILTGTHYFGDWVQLLSGPFGRIWHLALLSIVRWRNPTGALWATLGWMFTRPEFWLGGLVGLGFSAFALYLLHHHEPPN